MTFKFLNRALSINRNSKHRLDGIVIMKLIIAMLENLQGKIDEALPMLVQMIVTELNDCSSNKVAKNYTSMVV